MRKSILVAPDMKNVLNAQPVSAVANLSARPSCAWNVGVVRASVFVHHLVWHQRLIGGVGVSYMRRHRQRRYIHLGSRTTGIRPLVEVVKQIILVLITDATLVTAFAISQ